MIQGLSSRGRYRVAVLLALLVILAMGAWLRFTGLTATGFRNCDEGYYYHPALVMRLAGQPLPILYYYHGTIVWVHLGCRLLGFSPAGALRWAAVNGLAGILLLFLFCRKMLPTRTSLLAALCLAMAYYPVYYSRINLSNIYGMFFTLLAMLPLAHLAAMLDKATGDGQPLRNGRHLAVGAAAFGAIAGLTFHVRVESFLFLCGMAGALALAALIKAETAATRRRWAMQLLTGGAISGMMAIIAYALFTVAYLPWFRRDQTIEWYLKNVPFMTGAATAWGPYLFTHLWHLSGIPFWGIAILGVAVESRRWRTLALPRLWLLLCLTGAVIGFTLLGIPFPRAHLMLVVLMCIYWAIGVRLATAWCPGWRCAAAVILAGATFAGELRLIKPMFAKRAGYDRAAAVMRANPGDIIHNSNWPIFRSYLPGQKQFLLDELVAGEHAADDLAQVVDYGIRRGWRYLALDYYTDMDHFGDFLAPLAACAPAAILVNDYGEDFHNFMDARGRPPAHHAFSDKIALYDLHELSLVLARIEQ